jgi:DNA-directed RNA polymerase specialized sigma54-like protein
MVNNHLEDLALGHFQKVAHALGLGQNRVLEIYGVIRTLSPRPAASFGEEKTAYIIPTSRYR